MPVVAVVAAIAIDAGAIGAVAAGTLTTLSAITAIGATMGAIGAVTHNKTLTMIGGGLGLVGGIGSLAFGSGALGNVSDLFGSSTGGAANAAAGADSAAAASSVTDPGDAIVQGATDPAASAVTTTDLPPVGTINGTASTTVMGVPQVNAFAPSASGAADATATGAGGAGALDGLPDSVTQPFYSKMPPGSLGDAAQGAVDKLPGFSLPPSGLMDWAHNNQTLAYGVLQAGGSFISGLTNPMTPAQINALNSQAAANNAAATLAQRQVTNIGQTMPTVTGMPTPTGGLINNNPVKAPLITGAPNTGAATSSLMGTA